MHQNNIFDGESIAAQLARIIYAQLKTGNWVSYHSVLEEYYGAPLQDKLSAVNEYGELKRAFGAIRKALKDKQKGCIEESGNNRHKKFRYKGEDKDPLSEYVNASIIKNIKTYFKFCQDSAGLLPEQWIEHFFYNTNDLLQIRKRKRTNQQIITTDDRQLHRIELLPKIYEYITREEPFRIRYKPFIKEERQIIVHPHFLREYNGRWFVFGYEDNTEDQIKVWALDRIEGEIENVEGINYRKADLSLYQNRFNDIVGVTDKPNTSVNDVCIRVHDTYIWGLIQTKPLHKSQKAITDYNSTNGYGEIQLRVKTNNELIARILHYGEALEIIAPKELRDTVKKKVENILNRYN